MAENITTLLDKPDAENVSGSDYLYLVQGTGSDPPPKGQPFPVVPALIVIIYF